MWQQYVIDATMGYNDGLFTFCPIEGDIMDLNNEYTIITGMMFVGDMPPKDGKVVAIIHADGQEAVEQFCQEYVAELELLQARIQERDERIGTDG